MSGLTRPFARAVSSTRCSKCHLGSVRLPANGLRLYSSTPPPPRPPRTTPTKRAFSLPLAVLLVLPAAYYFYPSFAPSSKRALSPQIYSEQTVQSSAALSPTHKLVSIDVRPSDRALFGAQAVRRDGTPARTGGGGDDDEVVVQHVMIKSPDLQIERPYTPINDTETDGQMDLVVKRVRGGEVGRLIHSLKAGQDVGVRGPITTFSVNPSEYDRIVMISSGTGVAPMLQLLSKLPSSESSASPQNNNASTLQLHLVHALPQPGRPDWLSETGALDKLQSKLGDKLHVHRIPPGPIDAETLKASLGGAPSSTERLVVFVCLPPNLMRPLCGPLTVTLQQGELTGTLRDMGLSKDQVFKLE